MKRLGLIFILGVACAAGVFWWFSPDQVLKRRTQSLLHLLTLKSGTTRTERQLGIYPLSSLLSAQVAIDAPAYPEESGTFDRQEIESMYLWLCEHVRQSRFELKNLRSIRHDGEHAEVAFTMEADVELPDSHPVNGSYEVTFHWQRENDLWHLTRAIWLDGH